MNLVRPALQTGSTSIPDIILSLRRNKQGSYLQSQKSMGIPQEMRSRSLTNSQHKGFRSPVGSCHSIICGFKTMSQPVKESKQANSKGKQCLQSKTWNSLLVSQSVWDLWGVFRVFSLPYFPYQCVHGRQAECRAIVIVCCSCMSFHFQEKCTDLRVYDLPQYPPHKFGLVAM